MKRIISLLLAVLTFAGILTGCSGSAYIEGMDDGYSNVSTTHDGTVNRTNGKYDSRSTTGSRYDGAYDPERSGSRVSPYTTNGAAGSTGRSRSTTGAKAGVSGELH